MITRARAIAGGDASSELLLDYLEAEVAYAGERPDTVRVLGEAAVTKFLRARTRIDIRDAELSLYGRLLEIYAGADQRDPALRMCKILLARFGGPEAHRTPNFDLHVANALVVAADYGAWQLAEKLLAILPRPPMRPEHAAAMAKVHLRARRTAQARTFAQQAAELAEAAKDEAGSEESKQVLEQIERAGG